MGNVFGYHKLVLWALVLLAVQVKKSIPVIYAQCHFRHYLASNTFCHISLLFIEVKDLCLPILPGMLPTQMTKRLYCDLVETEKN